MERQRETKTDRERQTETDRDRQRQTDREAHRGTPVTGCIRWPWPRVRRGEHKGA